ncbi:MAG: diacylglycerol kinase family protein [Spirochaetota bacterium]
MQKTVLVYNPNSGRGKASERAIDFQEHWERKFGSGMVLRETLSKADIRTAMQETYEDFEFQVVMGGDGTLSEALQGLSELHKFQPLGKPIGVLPAGSGNSFLRDFGIKDYATGRDRLISAVLSEKVRNIDMGMISYLHPESKERTRRVFCNIFGIGVIPYIAELAMKMRFMGSLNYTVAALVKLFKHKYYTMDVVIDGVRETLDFDFLSVCNSKYTGGAMLMATDVEVDDGKMYLVAPHMKSKMQILKLFPKIFKGTHLQNKNVRHHFINNLEVKVDDPLLLLIDGELEKGIKPILTIEPAFWKLYVS